MRIHHIVNNGSDLGVIVPIDRTDSLEVRVTHFGQVARREYGQGNFGELDAYPRNWRSYGIDQMLESAKNAEFMIPTKSPHHGET